MTITFLVGAMANFVYGQPPNENDGKTTLRKVFMVPLLPELEEFKKRFKVKVATTYALTEGTLVMYSDFEKLNFKTCGIARKGFDLRIANDFDEELPPFSVGEILIRPKEPWTTMIGYYKMPEETIKAYRNQWLHTGDAMYKDEEGNYYFVDRTKDIIRRRGENISSFEVEREVNSHPAVLESAALPVKSEFSEDEIKIVIKLKPGFSFSPTELIRYLEPRMPYFMIPRYVEFVEEIPKTPTQKIQKMELRKTGIVNAWDREKAGIKIRR
jgi:crotonobetaine/carnitine-CoA ligase